MRNKYRLTFTKTGIIRYLGHNDLMRMMYKAIKRSGLPISYSKGFNPHQLASISVPLPLGAEGLAEYMDIELDTPSIAEDIISALNQVLPDGLTITASVPFPETEPSTAAKACSAKYIAALPENKVLRESLDSLLPAILESDEVIVNKRTKSGEAITNIRSDIFSLENISDEQIKISMLISTGSTKNIKPELVTGYIYSLAGIDFPEFEITYTRTRILLREDI